MTLAAGDAGAGPLLVGWARVAVAAPCLLATAMLFRARPVATLARGDALALAATGAAMAAYQVCYFTAVTLTGVAVAALLALCSAPLMIALLASLFLGERLTRTVRVSLGMALLGTALLLIGPRGPDNVEGRSVLGGLLALGAGLSYAVYAVGTKRLLARAAPLPLAAATFTLAALLITPALVVERSVRRPLAEAWPLLVYLGVGPTALAYILFTVGLRRVPATIAGVVSLLEPLTATTLGVMVFGEALGAAGMAGATLLLAALLRLTRAR
jgi:DME family drug/metabolite transporter